MKIINTKIPGLKILKSKNFYDFRGCFREVFKKKIIKKESENKLKPMNVIICPRLFV